jgi:outer membrane protein, heavy metal efflux system
MNRIIVWSGCAIFFIGGCQSAPRDAEFKDAQTFVAQRSGYDLQWDGHTMADSAVDDAVAKILAHPISADQAVQIALLNNRHLQADLEELGIAQADLVQAGLLKNPVFNLGVRFPDRAPSETYLDFAVASDFLDVIFVPARKKLAAQKLSEAEATLCDEVFAMVAECRGEFYRYQACEQSAELLRTQAAAANAAMQTAEALHKAGNINDLELANERAQALSAQLDLVDAEEASTDAREKLTARLGLGGNQIRWAAAGTLPDIPATEIATQDFCLLALRQRQDLAAARQEVLVQARTLGLTADYRFFQDVDLGPEFERETDGQWRIGPSLSIPIPLFDQGDAKLSRAKAMLRQSEQRYAALAIDIQSEVRAATSRLQSARTKALLYRDELLPVQRELLRQMQLQYNGMYVGVFQLLDARRQQIAANEKYIQSLRDYWIARFDLERAVGGRLTSTISTSQPANGERP